MDSFLFFQKFNSPNFFKNRRRQISASADGGPRSQVRARGTLRSASIGTSGNFPARVSAESTFNKFSHIPVKIGLIGGVGGIPQISFSFDFNIFVT